MQVFAKDKGVLFEFRQKKGESSVHVSTIEEEAYFNGFLNNRAEIVNRVSTTVLENQKGFITRFIDTKKNRLVKKMGITKNGLTELNNINNKIKTYLSNVTKRIPPEDVDKVRDILRAFRLELDKIVETNI